MNTTDCKFKIGETYKDRDGFELKLISRDDSYDAPLVFRYVQDGQVTCRHLDGRFSKHGNTECDILPNKRKEWVVTYTSRAGDWFADWYDSESEARARVKNLKSLTFGEQVRGPFMWEESE